VHEEKIIMEEPPLGGTESILLAEDDETVRNMTRTVLEQYGYAVIAASDGQEAVNKYKEHRDKIQLLLFDLVMPKKTGKEAYEEIRALTPGMKVLFSSGYAPDIIRQKVLLEDRMPIVFKPITPTELLNKVRETLDRG
jgi:polar amino acid transport system substrate-binding protein